MKSETGYSFPNGTTGGGLAARVPPTLAAALVLLTGTFWYATTRPLESLPAIVLAPSTGNWAILFSSIFGAVVLMAGLVGIGAGVAERRRTRRRMPKAPIRTYDGPQSLVFVQRLHEDIAICEARVRRARRSDDPREIARAAASGRQALDDILSELQAAGVRLDE